jgi:dTDP-glucose 4,6-dehydratase
MKILVTGGYGFIGSSLIKKISKDNEIFIIDNLDRQKNDFECCEKIDILDFEKTKQYVNEVKPDIVIHLAALCGVDNVIKRPIRTIEVNSIGTYNILKSVVENNISLKKFINFSTSEVYGPYSYKLGENESTTLGVVGEVRWSYAISKLMSEHLCFGFQKEYNLPIVSIRPFNIYGPGQIGEGALQVFIKKCLNDEDILINNDGSQIRSWCYIDDAVYFIEECINTDKVIGHVLNMGNPEGTISIIGLAKKVIELTKSKSKIKYVDYDKVDVELRIPNIDKAKKIFNYYPKVDLNEGILKTFEWYKNEKIKKENKNEKECTIIKTMD